MIRSLRTAEKAMQMEQVRIDALANNLANANSSGFRQILTRVAERAESAGGVARQASIQAQKSDFWPQMPALDMSPALDPRSGPVVATGRTTDVALMGRGFFAVATAEGERYTRNGSFALNEQRQLVTAEGHPVQGDGGALTITGEEFTIAADGAVLVDGNQVGRLKIVDFPDATRLEHLGANLLKAPEDQTPTAVPAEEASVAQAHLEGSNVNPVDTLVAMIAAQRAFEIHARVLSTEDEILSKSVNNLPRVSG